MPPGCARRCLCCWLCCRALAPWLPGTLALSPIGAPCCPDCSSAALLLQAGRAKAAVQPYVEGAQQFGADTVDTAKGTGEVR